MDSKGWGKHTSTMVSWSQLQVLGFESSPGHTVVTGGTGPLRFIGLIAAGACDGIGTTAKLGTGETRASLMMPGTGGNVPAPLNITCQKLPVTGPVTSPSAPLCQHIKQTRQLGCCYCIAVQVCCVIPPPFSCRHFDGEDVSCASDEHPKYAQSVGTAPLLSCPSSGVQIL